MCRLAHPEATEVSSESPTCFLRRGFNTNRGSSVPIQHPASLAQLVEQWTLNPWVTGSSPVGGSLISKRDLIVGSFFYFSKKELTLNRTLRACLSKRELFQMIIPSKIYALCYDISQETELKKETCVENCNHWL